MRKPINVYMVLDFVHKRREGIAEMGMTHIRASWIARGTGTVMYKSKACSAVDGDVARAAARALALAWLAKENARPRMSQNVLASTDWPGPRFTDTTGA